MALVDEDYVVAPICPEIDPRFNVLGTSTSASVKDAFDAALATNNFCHAGTVNIRYGAIVGGSGSWNDANNPPSDAEVLAYFSSWVESSVENYVSSYTYSSSFLKKAENPNITVSCTREDGEGGAGYYNCNGTLISLYWNQDYCDSPCWYGYWRYSVYLNHEITYYRLNSYTCPPNSYKLDGRCAPSPGYEWCDETETEICLSDCIQLEKISGDINNICVGSYWTYRVYKNNLEPSVGNTNVYLDYAGTLITSGVNFEAPSVVAIPDGQTEAYFQVYIEDDILNEALTFEISGTELCEPKLYNVLFRCVETTECNCIINTSLKDLSICYGQETTINLHKIVNLDSCLDTTKILINYQSPLLENNVDFYAKTEIDLEDNAYVNLVVFDNSELNNQYIDIEIIDMNSECAIYPNKLRLNVVQCNISDTCCGYVPGTYEDWKYGEGVPDIESTSAKLFLAQYE